jgi:hypothetical protein
MNDKDKERKLRDLARLAGYVGASDPSEFEHAELPAPLLDAVTTLPRRDVESITREKDGPPVLFV